MVRRPVIISSVPRNFDVDVEVNSSLSVEFDMDMDAKFFAGNILLAKGSGELISGRTNYRRKVMAYTPLVPLDKGVVYVLTIVGDDSLDDDKLVGVRNAAGVPMGGSHIIRFTTDSTGMILPPYGLSPMDQTIVKKNTITFSWEEIDGVSRYNIEISKSNTFTTLLYPPVDKKDTVLGTSLTPNIDFEEGIYYWRVKAIGASTNSDWSSIHQFNVSTTVEGKLADEDNEDIDLTEQPSFMGEIEVEMIEDFPAHLSTFVSVKTKNLFFRVIGEIDPNEIDVDSFTLIGTHISGDHEDENHGKVKGTITIVPDNSYTTYIIFSLEPLPIEANEDVIEEEVI